LKTGYYYGYDAWIIPSCLAVHSLVSQLGMKVWFQVSTNTN
jgi:hypothetical protein